ncbi:MAG: hypothetical protein JWM87_1469, partial [Candidatus Eremiobacteraeota bacterium]|nr:hypothetical protein [Candidatus Eremiobacteraeota bacterium]
TSEVGSTPHSYASDFTAFGFLRAINPGRMQNPRDAANATAR